MHKVKNSSDPLAEGRSSEKAMTLTDPNRRLRRNVRTRGSDVIYDLVDELLSPLAARWIATSDATTRNQGEVPDNEAP